MECAACGQHNDPEARFCLKCGARLANACPSCGQEMPAEALFCSQCGTRLAAPTPARPEPVEGPPAPPRSHPSSFVAGRYQVLRFLGEGGTKRVYLAHDTKLDRDVAFALLKTESLDEDGLTRLRREAQAMARLGDHPHVVAVYDIGEEPSLGQGSGQAGSGGRSGHPYLVCQYVAGGDVGQAIENASDHKVAVERILEITKDVTRGLEFAHSKGIVHRDLKPSNVWLTEDGTAKIGDFGLALVADRSRLTHAGTLVGTVAYMPPEQALGGEVTPRSDLYSLGCVLYEMVAGRPPFPGQDHLAIIGQHLNTPPVAPSWHNAQCPRAFEALILRLLAKDPKERPESAGDVLRALDAVHPSPTILDAPPVAEEANALERLAGGVFVGRQREMGQLRAALEDALSGRGRLVMLAGELGIGKSRTAQQLATYASLRGVQVLWGRCYEGTGAPPFWPWAQTIRPYIGQHDPEQLRSEMGTGAAYIAEIVAEVRERLPELKPSPPLEPEQARFRLFDSVTDFLKAASQHKPLMVILEDLHWADRPSLLLLEFLAKELSGTRLLVLGTYRDLDVSRQHPLALTLGELSRERGFQRVLLRGLGQEDVAGLIELATGIVPPPGLSEAIHSQTEGNPLFITEVVRLLAQEGELARDQAAQREGWIVRIPEGVREVIGRRLSRLSDRCNQVLTNAAVVGREFTLDQLRCLMEDLPASQMLDLVEEALAARAIEELPRAVGCYQFTHTLIQQTLAEELSLTRRVRLHARIAQALEEELYGPEAEAHAAELAHHFAEAETVTGPEKLVRYSLLAGEKALENYAWEEALGYFERGLAAKAGRPLDADTGALLFGMGRAQAALLQREEAGASLTRAFDYYVEAGDVDRALAVAEFPVGNTGVPELVLRALDLVPPDSHAAGRLLSQHALRVGQRGDYKAAQNAVERALAIARREGDVALEMWTLARAGNLGTSYLRPQECLLNHGQALELNSRVGDPHLEVFSRNCVVHTLMGMGDPQGAQRHAQSMLTHAEASRYLRGWSRPLGTWPGRPCSRGTGTRLGSSVTAG